MSVYQSPTDEILNSIGEGVFTVDKNFKITFFNRSAEKMTGFRREEITGKYCSKIFQSSLCLHDCPIVQVLRTGTQIHDIDYEIADKSGRRIPLRLNAAVLRNQEDEPVGGVISFRALSDLERHHDRLRQAAAFHGMLGTSKVMNDLFQLIEEISGSDANVLIQGESGTGKEMAANAIQATSTRSDQPFIKVNCSVFPPQLLASELFGHVRGAFTGAIKDRAGRFQLANHGTIFLDEVVEMPLQMQLQLLRVLQEGTFERVGESITRRVDVRTIAGTNMNIQQAIADGQFREDLFYRLNVVPIELPPLRQRLEDIPNLVKYFLHKFALLARKDIHEIENDVMDLLLDYPWPGNVRELENAIEYAIARTREPVIRAAALPPTIRQAGGHTPNQGWAGPSSGDREDDYQHMIRLLDQYHWNRSRVAKAMGIGRTTLWRRLKALGLESPRDN